MTTDPPDEPTEPSWRWDTGPEEAPRGRAPGRPLSPSARRLGWYVVAPALTVMVAAYLPWKTYGDLHVAGTAGDGLLTLVLGLVAAMAGLARVWTRYEGRWQTVWPAIALTMSAMVILVGYSDIQSVAKIATVGIGLIVTLLGGLGVAAASLVAILRRD
jgi:hypothetical protein